MMAVDILKKDMPVARISRAMDIPRSSIYYRRIERSGRKPRVSESIETEIIRISGERTTYGYRRVWALMRNSGIHVNIKTVRRIMRRNSLALPYARHKNRTRSKDLTKPHDINRLWETDIHYVSTKREGMAYLMSIKDCFSKKWISYEFSRTCTAKDCIRAVECNRRLNIVHFRRNKSDPDRRFNSDPFPHVEEGQSCTGWRCGE